MLCLDSLLEYSTGEFYGPNDSTKLYIDFVITIAIYVKGRILDFVLKNYVLYARICMIFHAL